MANVVCLYERRTGWDGFGRHSEVSSIRLLFIKDCIPCCRADRRSYGLNIAFITAKACCLFIRKRKRADRSRRRCNQKHAGKNELLKYERPEALFTCIQIFTTFAAFGPFSSLVTSKLTL